MIYYTEQLGSPYNWDCNMFDNESYLDYLDIMEQIREEEKNGELE